MSIPLNFKKPAAQPATIAPVAEPSAPQDRIESVVALSAVQAFNAEIIPVLDRLTASIDRALESAREREEAYASSVAGSVKAAPSDDDQLVQDMLRAGRAAGTRSIVETAARLHRDLAANKHVRLDADGWRTLVDLAVTLNQAVMLNQALARMGASGSAGA